MCCAVLREFLLIIKSMKRQALWNDLQAKMSGKRTRNDAMSGRKKKSGSSAPHEIIVQRLASEPDTKQTFRPVQPREFVNFEYEDLSLVNLKKACAAHFNLPASTCDVLVSNKGPSCTNIGQIPHRKDKVLNFIPHSIYLPFTILYNIYYSIYIYTHFLF